MSLRHIAIGLSCLLISALPVHAQIVTPWSGPMPQADPSITSGWVVYGSSDQPGGATTIPTVTPQPLTPPQAVPTFARTIRRTLHHQ